MLLLFDKVRVHSKLSTTPGGNQPPQGVGQLTPKQFAKSIGAQYSDLRPMEKASTDVD